MGRSKEYYEYIQSDKWRATSRLFRTLFLDRCVLFPWLRSKHTHHMSYNRFQSEWFWIDCLPLSESAHAIIHVPFFWKCKPIRFLINWYLRLAAIVLFPIIAICLTAFTIGDILCLMFCPQLFIGTKKQKKKYKKMVGSKAVYLKAAKR